MKTPEEIKRGLLACTELVMPADVQHAVMVGALAYIQQLESNYSQVKKALQDNGFQTLEELLQAYSQVKIGGSMK